jgi:integrase/recombinase XerD
LTKRLYIYYMSSIKIILRNKANKDGTYPLALQIIKDRRASLIHIGHSIKKAEWDNVHQTVKKAHPNSVRLNNLLLKKKAEANNTLIELESNNKDTSSQVIKSRVKPTGNSGFFGQASIFINNLQLNGKYNRYKTEDGRVERFREFLKSRGIHDIQFSEITVNLLNQFRAYLKTTRKVKGVSIKERTIINHLLLIRTIYNQAIKNHIIDKKQYPFGKDKVAIKFPDSIKVGLTAGEVKILENIPLARYYHHARNVWLLSYYFAGMRLADVLKLRWSDFIDDRLHYAMSKNLKAGSLKVPAKALAILEQYLEEHPKHDFVFPELKGLEVLDPYELQRKIAFAGKRLETTLKAIAKSVGIHKNISMHLSRHSFAQIAGDKISIQLLQRLYRHSSITTTIGYQSQFINKETDDALDTILSV